MTHLDFKFSSCYFFFDDGRFAYKKKNTCKKIWPENWKSSSVTLCRIQCKFQNCICFSSSIDSFWLLFFWRSKNETYRKAIFIIIIGYSLLLSFCVTIWMCLIAESYVLVWYFSVRYELGFSMHLVIMTSPRYYDVTHFWYDCNETWNAMKLITMKHSICKIENKTISLLEISSFSPSFSIYKRILWRQ